MSLRGRKRFGEQDLEDHDFSEGPGGGMSYVPSLETTMPEDGEADFVGGGGDGDDILTPEAAEAHRLLEGYDMSSVDDLAGLEHLDPTVDDPGDDLGPDGSGETAREVMGSLDLSALDDLAGQDFDPAEPEVGSTHTPDPSTSLGRPSPRSYIPAEAPMAEDFASTSAEGHRGLDRPSTRSYIPAEAPMPESFRASSEPAETSPATPPAAPPPERQETAVPGRREAVAAAPEGEFADTGEFADPDAPDSASGALGDPTEETKQAPDPRIAMWDDRIHQLEDLEARTRSAAMRRVLRRMITSAISAGSRAISMYGANGRRDMARRPYERSIGEQSGEEGALENIIAELGGEWSNTDQMRDQASMQAQEMRTAASAQSSTDRHRQAQEARWSDQSQTEAVRRERMGAQTERTRGQHQRDEAEILPESDVSGRSREEFEMAMATLPEDVQESFRPRLDNLPHMSAREVDMLRSDIQRFAQGRLADRRGPPRTGGRGIAPDAAVAASESRLSRLVEAGVTDRAHADRILEGMRSPNPRIRREVEGQIDNLEARLPSRPRAQAGEETDEGVEILPGVRAHGPPLEPRERVLVRESFDRYRGALGHLGRVRDLVDQHGGLRALLDPQVRAQIQRHMPALRAMVTEIQRTGIIQIGEREMIDAELPDPTSATQEAFQTWRTNLDEWELQNNDMAMIALEDRGVDGPDLVRAHSLLHAPAGRAPAAARPQPRAETAPTAEAPAESEYVVLYNHGNPVRVHRSRVAAALAAGRTEEP